MVDVEWLRYIESQGSKESRRFDEDRGERFAAWRFVLLRCFQ